VTYARSAMFPARLGALRPMGAFLEEFCAAASIGRAPCLRLNLLLEELFTNTVRHGHHGDCDAPVWVTLSAGPASVDLVYEDTAAPFNPYAQLAERPDNGALEGRRVGGLGVLLTKELASSRDYAYLFGRNRIKLALAL
jgi:serine/threonine-protein kinase RsbW